MTREFKSGAEPRFITLEDGKFVELFFDEQELAGMRAELACQILPNYQPRFGNHIPKDQQKGRLIALTVLNGAKPFSEDMLEILQEFINLEQDSIKLSSYGQGIESSGQVTVVEDMKTQPQENDEILIFEDIVDTGETMETLTNILIAKGFKRENIKICALLSKPSRRTHEVHIDYLGVKIPNRFIFGYGLDDAEKRRELPFIVAYPEQASIVATP